VLSASTGGSSTYYERDASGALIAERGAGGEFYYVTDGLGSTVALVDTTGTVQATYSYDPYGNTTTIGGANPVIANGNPFRYASGYNDTTTGLYHFGQRYYNPTTGRFTQQDSLNTPLDPTNGNRYAYVGANPINATDPSGASSCNTTIVLTAFGVAALIGGLFAIGTGVGALGGIITANGGAIALGSGIDDLSNGDCS